MGGRHQSGGTAVRPIATVRRWFAGLQIRQIRQLSVLAVLAVTALFGGLDTVNTTVTPFKPGEQFSDGRFTITIHRATSLPEVRAGQRVIARAKEGRRYLGIVADVRNDSTDPGGLINELDLRGQPDKDFIGVFRNADGSPLVALGPGLSEEVAFLWSLPEDAVAAGDSATVRVWKKKYGERMVTYGKGWVDSLTDYGETVIPVKVVQ